MKLGILQLIYPYLFHHHIHRPNQLVRKPFERKEMLLKWHHQHQQGLHWLLGCFILVSFLWFPLLPIVRGDDAEDDVPGLLSHYQRLYQFYHTKQALIKSDCKLKADIAGADDPNHIHWGTIETLEFLSGKRVVDVTSAEKRMNLSKLRQYLARIGYLKDPGSLVFLNTQSQTIRLTGCGADAVWRQHGAANEDGQFQIEYHMGNYRNQAPSGINYIHKYTCFNTGNGKCTHTFYVITKMLPELPLGLLVREYGKSEEYQFPCTVPICRITDCPAVLSISRRAYPPFKVYWIVPSTLYPDSNGPKDNIVTRDWYNTIGKNIKSDELGIVWDDKLRVDKDAELDLMESYKNPDDPAIAYDWMDAFGEMQKPQNGSVYALQSRIQVLRAEENSQVGLYECVIEDANGVVTTPNVIKEEYRGDAVIHVMHDELFISYALAFACLVITALIIILCPRKLENEDGTPYTQDELRGVAESRSENFNIRRTIVNPRVHDFRATQPEIKPMHAIITEENKHAIKHVTKHKRKSSQQEETPAKIEKVQVHHVKPTPVVADVGKYHAEPHTNTKKGSEGKPQPVENKVDKTGEHHSSSNQSSQKSKKDKKKKNHSESEEKPRWRDPGHASIARQQPNT